MGRLLLTLAFLVPSLTASADETRLKRTDSKGCHAVAHLGAAPADEKYYSVTYNVDDLVTVTKDGKPDYQALIDAIKTRVLPPTWDTQGGEASIAAFEANRSLVVSHKQAGHEELVRFIRSLRAQEKP